MLDLALAFTQPVPRLSANMFSVTGPPKMTSTDLERVDGSDSYFTFSVTLPETYYGSVKVAMNRVSIQPKPGSMMHVGVVSCLTCL